MIAAIVISVPLLCDAPLLFLVMGGLLLLGLVFSLPEIIRVVRVGDVLALRNVVSALGGRGDR